MKKILFRKFMLISTMFSILVLGLLFSKSTLAYADTEYHMTGTAKQNGFTFTYSYDVSFPNYMIAYSSADATITGYSGTTSDIAIPQNFSIPVSFPDSVTESRVRIVHNSYGMPISNIIVQVNAISSSAFKDKLTCTSVTFPASGTSTINIGDEAFAGCTNLTKVSVTPLIVAGNNVFKNCPKLSKAVITFPTYTSFGGENWKVWDKNLFMNCTSLTSLEVQAGIIRIENNTFEGCTNLSTITVPSTLQKIGKAVFNDTSWYKNKPDGLVYVGTALYKYKGSIPSNTNISLVAGTTLIVEEAFANCTDVAAINIPSSMKYINSNAFIGCINLNSVTLPTGITTIGSTVFSGCQSLASVIIYNGNNMLISVWDESVFQNNPYIKSLVFQDGVALIDGASFSGCTNLISVVIPASVTSIGSSAFSGCSSLEGIDIPSSVTTMGNNTFTNCFKLSYVSVSTNLKTIGTNIFAGCNLLQKVFIQKSLTGNFLTSSTSWNVKLFAGIGSIKSLMFSEGITYIGDMTFAKCTGLKEVSIPETVRTLGFGVFSGCSSLVNIYLPSSITSIAAVSSGDVTKMEVGDTVYLYYNAYPEGTKQWYSNSEAVKVVNYSGGTCFIQAVSEGSCQVSCYTKYKTTIPAWIETSVGGYWGVQVVENGDIHTDSVTVFPGTFENSGVKVINGKTGSYAESYAKARGFTFTVSTGSSVQNIEKYIFDATIYAANNPDVVAALGSNYNVLLNHWLNNGIAEGRIGSRVFNAQYYLENNGDLATLYGSNYKAAYTHFVNIGCLELRPSSAEYKGYYYKNNYSDLSSANGEDLLVHYVTVGQKEGRTADKSIYYLESDYAAVYDLVYYKTNNPDVAAAFGDNNRAILKHFVDSGMAEGRRGSAHFDVKVYRKYNPDLAAAYGDNLKSYYLHYIQCGKNEGRIAVELEYVGKYNATDYSAVFDLEYYKAKYPEVVSLCTNNDAKILDYFVDNGIASGQQGSAAFDVVAYRKYNPDVAAAYGDNLKSYYLHYIRCGRNEGRVAVEVVYVGKYNAADYADVFDLAYYKANNPDVASAYNNNEAMILDHFVDCGMAEGRMGCAGFNIKVYRASNPDLAAAFGDNLKSYYLHYIRCGKIEGRKAVEATYVGKYNAADYEAVFNLTYYKTNNPDVVNANGGNDAKIIDHFVIFGMAEGRQGSASFNVAAYRAKNSDVAAAYGVDLKSYYLHYMMFGKKEGRIAV